MSGTFCSNRDAQGRFAKGNQYARGRSTSNAGRRGELEDAMLDAVTPDVMHTLAQVLIRMASDGNMQAMRMLLTYTLGRSPAAKNRPRDGRNLAEMQIDEFSPEMREELFAIAEEVRQATLGPESAPLDEQEDKVTAKAPFDGDGRDEGRETGSLQDGQEDDVDSDAVESRSQDSEQQAREKCERTASDDDKQSVTEKAPLNGDENWRERDEELSLSKLSEREQDIVPRYGVEALFDWCPERREWVREARERADDP